MKFHCNLYGATDRVEICAQSDKGPARSVLITHQAAFTKQQAWDFAQAVCAILNDHEELADVAAQALPFVEDAETDQAYKPGVVKKLSARLRAVIERHMSIPANRG